MENIVQTHNFMFVDMAGGEAIGATWQRAQNYRGPEVGALSLCFETKRIPRGQGFGCSGASISEG